MKLPLVLLLSLAPAPDAGPPKAPEPGSGSTEGADDGESGVGDIAPQDGPVDENTGSSTLDGGAGLDSAPMVAPEDDVGPSGTAEVGVVKSQEEDPTIFPDPRKFSTGFFVEGSTGPMVALGPTSQVLSPGFSLSARTGYEIRRWVALQLHATGSMSKYDDGVLHGELMQQYFYTGEARFGIPIRRFLIALQGGAGIWQTNSNLLQVADIAADNNLVGFAWDAGAGLDYHSLNRHFSTGVLATYVGMPGLQNAGALTVHLYLRYVAGKPRGGKGRRKKKQRDQTAG